MSAPSSSMGFTPDVGPDKARHPKGLYVLFATEMWERFSFYTLLAMLTLYLQDKVQGFGWTDDQATRLYSNYNMFVYASPLVGGLLADKFLGLRRSITIGGLFMMVGHILLGLSSTTALYAALACLVVGNGFFKPNVSTMVGTLYPQGSPLRDSAYSLFYMGINVGAFVAPLVAEVVKQKYGFHPAFMVAGGGMAISLIVFWSFQRLLVDRQDEVHAVQADRKPSALESVPEWKRISALIVVFAIVIVFWMIFHQNGSTLTYWADKNTDWESSRVTPVLIKILTLNLIDGSKVSGIVSNAIEPLWIVLLSFPLVKFWGFLNRKGLEPSTPAKMALGMTLTACSFLILYVAARSGGDTGKVSPWWLISAYAVLALAELLLSPMGLSLVSKVAPLRMRGLLMGGWFVATAIGNKLTMIGVYWNKWLHSSFFLVLASLALAMAVLLVLLLRPLKKAMPGV